MKAKLAALAALSREERRLFQRIWFSFLLADVGLRLFSLLRVQRLLAWRFGLDPDADTRSVQPSDLERVIATAARHHILPLACLHRSLVLQALLRSKGLAADLRIGVRRLGDKLEAHAWLEQAGQLLCEPAETRELFAPLLRAGEAG